LPRIQGYHLLFVAALVMLVSLGAWWTIFLGRAIGNERSAGEAELRHAAHLAAVLIGHGEPPDDMTILPGSVSLELLACEDSLPGDLSVPAMPKHARLCVRPTLDQIEALEERHDRRRHMVVGEGTVMFLALGVVWLMLLRMVRQERRHRTRMESFIHAVTHEMKTPLAGIMTLLETALSGRIPADAQPRLFTLGLKEAERLEHGIENVLLAGRIRSGYHRVELREIDVREEMEALAEHRRRTLLDRPEALELVWEGDEPLRASADPDMLRVVLENLVDNGFKYGGVEPRVVLRVRAEAAEVHIRVEDDGIGFEPGEAEDLFQPFRRNMKDGHGASHGTGLGLSIARTLSRDMGGDLTAHSKGPDQGAWFLVTLPRVPEGK